MPNLANFPSADIQAGAKLWSGPGYIDGLQMQWVSATAVTVSSGRAYIPSLGYYLDAPNAIALTGLALTASTFYHLYLYDNAGTPAIECVTTAPDAPYSGTARAKTGDTSRRYIGSVLTDSGGNIVQFVVDSAGDFRYLIPNTSVRVLANGKATVRTTASLAGFAPVTASHVILAVSNTDGGVYVNLSNSFAASASVIGISPGGSTAGVLITFPTDASQGVDYYYSSTPTNGFYLDVIGFKVGR